MMTYMSRADAPSIAPTQPERKSEGAHGASARAPMKGPSDAQREELGRLHPVSYTHLTLPTIYSV